MNFYREIEEKLINDLFTNYKKPMLIFGARQVGKTSLIKKIVEKHKYVYLNLEESKIETVFDESINPEVLISKISLLLDIDIDSDTILFIDEIQVNPRAITSLKYFCEQNKYKVIASGSNLGVKLMNNASSYPVGKIKTYTMYPISFNEFLVNTNKKRYINAIKEATHSMQLDLDIHNKILEIYDIYMSLGGMPEILDLYLNGASISEIDDSKEEIIDAYKIDILKYADKKINNRILSIFDNIDVMLKNDNQKFKITKIDNLTYKTSDDPIEYLKSSGLIYQIHNIQSINKPLRVNITENNFKLVMHDHGLLMEKAKYKYYETLESNDKIYYGFICENYVANILRRFVGDLFYFTKATSEIDFIAEINNKIIPIEVKSGTNLKAKSLASYCKR